MRTITALFDSRTEAEAARDELCASNASPDRVNIIDQSTEGYSSDSYSTHENRGVWASIKDTFLPDEDRMTYEEGVRRGSYLLTAQVDEANVDNAVAILERGSVDLDQRQNEWKSQGWSGYNAADMDRNRTMSNDEQTIKLAEENISIGKREVERGGVKVRSYVTETPVREEVSLREEHVNVERRPVDQPLTGDADRSALFQEREIEMRETSEEAVVSKQARVTEEIGISKTADTRTEVVEDTVRKTEVDIDDATRTTGSSFADTDRSATRTTTDVDYDSNRKL